jgi:uncharacterized protein YegL
MNKKKFIPSLLLSFLIHLGLLTGIDVFLAPTPGMPEWPELIPVDMVIIEEKEGGSQSDLTFKKTGFPKDPLIAKAETAKGTPSTAPVEDFPGPIPKEGTFKPSLNVEQIPTPGVLPPGQEGKEVQSRQVVSRSLSPPQRLPEIPPSPSDQSPLLEVEEPRALTLAKKGGIPTDSATLEKITAPLGRNRPHPDFVSNLLPIPTVRSPAVPEEREMMLARQEETLQSRVGKSMEPFTTGFEKRGTLVGAGKGFSMLLVLDTSGSVKGSPLEGIKKSAMEFVSLLGKMDRCAVITFNDEANLVVPFTSDKNSLKQKIARLMTKGKNTVLFDALDLAILLLKKEKDKKRFIVLFSDGKDEGSRSNPREVIKRARKSEVAVFCLGYSRVEKRYLKTLESISQRTGGIFAEAPHFGEIVELFRATRDVRGKKES